jgi:hypothetical protein
MLFLKPHSGQFDSTQQLCHSDNSFTISQTIPSERFAAHASLGNALIESSELKVKISRNELVHQIKRNYSICVFIGNYCYKRKMASSRVCEISNAAL